MEISGFPTRIFSGYWGSCHCQGIAVDRARGEIYYSFTTKLVKTDLRGRLIGSVDGLTGHLGCIDFCEADGRVYGSLEYKNDAVGKGILSALGRSGAHTEAFYCAIFDGAAITRPDMDAGTDGVMRAVYLPDVTEAYLGLSPEGKPHRWGCSGIDGTGWGKAPGGDKDVLLIAAGIYGDVTRADNDYQVLFRYDGALSWWDTAAKPLLRPGEARDGARADERLFLYTGNTRWGVQNLEYDETTGDWYLAVYPGEKKEFPNYSLFVLDGARAPLDGAHRADGTPIREVFLKPGGGSCFPYGSTGMCALGDGLWYFSREGSDFLRGQYTNVCLYRAAAGDVPFLPVNAEAEIR